MSHELKQLANRQTRRSFLGSAGVAVGALSLHSLLADKVEAKEQTLPHFAPKAKRIIYLCQSGAPSQHDLFDYKPALLARQGEELPESIRMGQRLTTMTSGQDSLPLTPSQYAFAQHGKSGMWFSELVPHQAKIADRMCQIRSLHTEAINHDPGMTMLFTGHQLPGRPSLGSWLSYGLGSENEELPTFVVLVSQGSAKLSQQPIFDRLWSSAFLPSRFQGVRFRGGGEPVLYLNNPAGISLADRRRVLDTLAQLNQRQAEQVGDPEIETRVAQYEMAYRMQMSIPQLTDFSDEPESVFMAYGEDARKPGSYAANCLLARRLAERGVRYIQLFHRGWDQHRDLATQLPLQCRDTDQASAALVNDLARLGLLEDTLVVWGGEFGRTAYAQGDLANGSYGRDHHGRCFTMWLAGGGVKGDYVHGASDEFGYNITENPVHVHDLNATLLHLLGVDHRKFTYRFQSRDYRLTDIYGNVVDKILA
ncbi:DUF1501 domain-containing protein [Bremerella cremea]|uniref:DUF1501 domain-containing protein n=1 Tax=Bremerella cremea TaxID=1031537 RepID=A0A368KTL2_9BACT|nr:DUF1501 domain-containing protein [Bremerella cremea]RCS52883.1 DUF1501 domain-containing protein [Bremerella cremea]